MASNDARDGHDRGGEHVHVCVVSVAEVDKSLLDDEMSDDEVRSAVLRNGDPQTCEELAQSISDIRAKLGGEDDDA